MAESRWDKFKRLVYEATDYTPLLTLFGVSFEKNKKGEKAS